MAEVILSEKNFEQEVINSNIPCVVDFYATWCGPCKMLAPILEEFANDNEGKIKVCKINVDENLAISAKYGIVSIPTLMLFKNGEVIKTSLGYITRAQLDSFAEV